MYNCSKEFNKYYRKKVVLSESKQNELRNKRKLNVKRLKNGIKKYNQENKTSYKISEDRIQGSMAMHTVVQNDENNYDIDVGIVFEKDSLDGFGPQATRNMVANSLKKETWQFTEAPEVKTSCVRIKYSEGYHVDFAVYRRFKEYEWEDGYSYEHAGAEWSKRDLKALEEWFKEEIKCKGDVLRKIIRLSKTFCRSRESWKEMPSGLVQTVICSECLDVNYERLDEIFYYTMKNIVDRLSQRLEVYAPVDNNRSLVNREIDFTRMENWKNRLKTQLEELDIIFDPDCTKSEALEAWSNFFDAEYFEQLITKNNNQENNNLNYRNTEDFIDDIYPVLELYDLSIDCRVSSNGFREKNIYEFLNDNSRLFKKFVPYNFKVRCRIKETNCPKYDEILWKVKNVGDEAIRRDCVRGQIKNRGKEIVEPTSFAGPHYIECYLIKDGVCVAIDHVDVPIGE